MKKIIAFLITVFLLQSYLFAQWTQVNDLHNGEIKTVCIKGGQIFAGANLGIYRSSNGGNNWVKCSNGLSSRPICSITSFNNVLFACSNDGYTGEIYFSTNDGNYWNRTAGSLSTVVPEKLAANLDFLFAVTSAGIYRTSNNGSNWTSLNNGLTNPVYSLSVNGSTLYAGTVDGFSVSTNNGVNWSVLTNELSGWTINSILKKNNLLFACAKYHGIYSSTNNGINWTQLNTSELNFQTLVLSGTMILAGSTSTGYIYRSTNDGINWLTGELIQQNAAVNSLATDGMNIYAGTSAGFFRSGNGANWTVMNFGLNTMNIGGVFTSGSTILAGGDATSVYVSVDNGVNWTKKFSTNNKGFFCKFCQNGSYLFACAAYDYYSSSGSLYRSNDNGNNWSIISTTFYNSAIAVNNGNIYISSGWGGIQVSTNNGNVWNTYATGICNGRVKSLAFSNNRVYAGSDRGIYRSTNNGANWTVSGLTNIEISKILIYGGIIYTATPGGVYKSIDDGLSWNLSGLYERNVFDIQVVGGRIIAATDYGIFLSSDSGNNWEPRNDGFELIPSVFSITVKDDYLYIGTAYSSVWKRLISDIIGIHNISTEVPISFSLYQNYPNPFNPVTKIRFDLAENGKWKSENGNVTLKIYDILGKEVATLVNEKLQPGTYEATWDASGFGSGVYFYTLATDGEILNTRKMFLVR